MKYIISDSAPTTNVLQYLMETSDAAIHQQSPSDKSLSTTNRTDVVEPPSSCTKYKLRKRTSRRNLNIEEIYLIDDDDNNGANDRETKGLSNKTFTCMHTQTVCVCSLSNGG